MKRHSWWGAIFVLLTAGLLLMVFSLSPAQAKARAKKAKAAPAAAAAKTEAAAAEEETEGGREVLHMVRRGEELHMLAGYYYSDCRQWPKIYRENRQLVKNPNLIYPGEVLAIDVPEDWQPYMSYEEFFRKATIGRSWAATTAVASLEAVEAKPGEEEKPQAEAPPAKATRAKTAAPAKQKGQ